MKQLQTALLNYKDDHATTGKELDSVLKYLDELKPQCETKVLLLTAIDSLTGLTAVSESKGKPLRRTAR